VPQHQAVELVRLDRLARHPQHPRVEALLLEVGVGSQADDPGDVAEIVFGGVRELGVFAAVGEDLSGGRDAVLLRHLNVHDDQSVAAVGAPAWLRKLAFEESKCFFSVFRLVRGLLGEVLYKGAQGQ